MTTTPAKCPPRRIARPAEHRPGPVLVSRRRLARRVAQLGRQIARCYAGRELTVVAVMTGSLLFLADLIRRLDLPVRLVLVRVRSYQGPTTCPRPVRVSRLADELAGKHVLVVDDILDCGATLSGLLSRIARRRPASVRTCVLLRKRREGQGITPDFVGFEIDDAFVIGYGLDYDNLYRNLPDVHELTLPPPRATRLEGRR